MSPFSPEAGARPLMIKDLLIPVPSGWTVEEPKQHGEGVQVSLRFAIAAESDEIFVRAHKAPRFDGSILVECEPTDEPLAQWFAARMATFMKNVPTARVVREEAVELGGNGALLREHVFNGPGAALYRQRFIASNYAGSTYIVGTTNAAGALFDAAARVLEECMDHTAWRADAGPEVERD